ncbi:uncharacterized protein LOC113558449 [Rhopalosiphum maidis]|uniref:uncharacterized protein LOC113558449 n=1 Tax=Rhopalosiphum maidis TaxID=43146 RepID=UPI000F006051|nr:uncharacterized protein LOC113558449 [Rhopalosiphum maidis]XP_026819708.1 uncharacterized protein LOC113558449 [Rhopalosiphum maidis]
MGLCFVCDEELDGHYVRLATTRTSYGNELLLEKIAGVLGEEFVVVVNNDDLACNNCASQLNQIDKLEIDLKLVKNAMLSCIRKKYGILVADEDVEAIKVDKEYLKGVDSPKVSNPLKINRSPNLLIQQVKKPIKFLNARPIPQQVPTPQVSTSQQVSTPQASTSQQVSTPQVSTSQQVSTPRVSTSQQISTPQQVPRLQVPRPQPSKKQLRVMLPHQVQNSQLPLNQQQINKQQNGANSLKIHKSDAHVQNHVPQSNKIEPGKPIKINQNAVKISTPIPQKKKKSFFRCQICAKAFDTRERCIEHIQNDHKKPVLNKLEKKIENSGPGTSNAIKVISINHKVESPMNDNELNNKKCTVDIAMSLKDSVPVEKSKEEKETENTGESGDIENPES